jgi:hypothetical protein
LRISLKYVLSRGVPYIVGKLSTRATILLYTSFYLEVFTRSYGLQKFSKS